MTLSPLWPGCLPALWSSRPCSTPAKMCAQHRSPRGTAESSRPQKQCGAERGSCASPLSVRHGRSGCSGSPVGSSPVGTSTSKQPSDARDTTFTLRTRCSTSGSPLITSATERTRTSWLRRLPRAFTAARTRRRSLAMLTQLKRPSPRGSPPSATAGRTGDRIRDGRCHPSRTTCHGTSTSRRLTIFSRQTCTRRSNPQASRSATEPTGRRARLRTRDAAAATSGQSRSSQA